jgi:antitoxin FitA
MQIKNVPDDVHRVLRQRAAKAGQSQQEYLLALLVDQARTPTLDEIFERVEQRSGGSISLAFAAAAQRADRDAR